MTLRWTAAATLPTPPACNTPSFHPEALDSELSSTFRQIAALPGWFDVDDCAYPSYPGVTTTVEAFLAERPDFQVLADLNRHGAGGRKLYLATREAPALLAGR